jgi:hypothetical protein
MTPVGVSAVRRNRRAVVSILYAFVWTDDHAPGARSLYHYTMASLTQVPVGRPWNERPAERHDSCHEEREWARPKCLQLKLASL